MSNRDLAAVFDARISLEISRHSKCEIFDTVVLLMHERAHAGRILESRAAGLRPARLGGHSGCTQPEVFG